MNQEEVGEKAEEEVNYGNNDNVNEEDNAYNEDKDNEIREKIMNDLNQFEQTYHNINENLITTFPDYVKDNANNNQAHTKIYKNNKNLPQNENKLEMERGLTDKYQNGNSVSTPWWSIELVFNRKNIWANMRNFKPISILYH